MHYLNVTYGHVLVNRYAINELNIKVTTLNKTLMMVLGETKFIKFTVAIMTDMRMILARLTIGLMSLQENVNAIYEYMRVLSTRKVNPLIIPLDTLRQVLAQAKEDMKQNPELTLAEDPNVNIWNYYTIMKITPIIMENFLLVIYIDNTAGRPVLGYEFIQSTQSSCITPATEHSIPISIGR